MDGIGATDGHVQKMPGLVQGRLFQRARRFDSAARLAASPHRWNPLAAFRSSASGSLADAGRVSSQITRHIMEA